MVDHPDVQPSLPDPRFALSLLFKHAKSPAMKRVLAKVQRCAQVQLPVLLRGETGTGKDLVAQALHAARAPRAPLLTVNCGAIAQRLAESELFGHKKGAFTGASQDHQGVFQRAGEGCVFLDELGEMPLELQAKLLRVLENRRFFPVGGDRELSCRANLIAATHRPLEAWIAQGRFREDLFYRLNILSIELPALRHRPEDMPSLLEHFAAQAAEQLDTPVKVTPCAVAWAQTQRWPGNLRELRNLVLCSAVLQGSVISQASLQQARPTSHQVPCDTSKVQVSRGSLQAMKQALIEDALARHSSLREAALALGVPKSTLGGWAKKLEMQACAPISKTG